MLWLRQNKQGRNEKTSCKSITILIWVIYMPTILTSELHHDKWFLTLKGTTSFKKRMKHYTWKIKGIWSADPQTIDRLFSSIRLLYEFGYQVPSLRLLHMELWSMTKSRHALWGLYCIGEGPTIQKKCQKQMEVFQYARVRADDSSQAPLQLSAQSICNIMSAWIIQNNS